MLIKTGSQALAVKRKAVFKASDSPLALGQGTACALNRTEALGTATITDTVAALGVAVSAACGVESPILNLSLAGVHGLRGAAFLMGAKGKSGVQLQQRLGVAVGETLMATGNVLAALGQSAWSIPVVLTGAALNLVADYRYRSSHEAGTEPKPLLTWSAKQTWVNAGDAAIGLSMLSPGPAVIGGGLGALGHLGLAAACYTGKGGIAAANTHSQHSKGYAHAMLAAGMFATAAGAGCLAAVPLLAGAIGTNLQDLRDSTL